MVNPERESMFIEGPRTGIYLNPGTMSRTPISVLEKVEQYAREYEQNPTLSLFEGWERMWEVQKKVASFFAANPEDWFFRPNVTVAMNDFLLGIELPPGDIAVTNLEYGAIVNICRHRAEKEGRRLLTVNIPVPFLGGPEELVDIIMNQLPASVVLLMVSHVTTGTGLRIPVS
ncbi:MAG: cysteine desulfurase, partial [Bdellovibrionaceae bacterium]|nr:cysteine desulfurase [Pseudobdellovibrionaceae bacterium]